VSAMEAWGRVCVAALILDLGRKWFERSAPLLDRIVPGTHVMGG
jgi:hypothetical protein